MIKKLIFYALLFFTLPIMTFVLIQKNTQRSTATKINQPVPKLTVSPTFPPPKEKSSIFVPYWNIPDVPLKNYDQIFYFGISAGTDGVDSADAGYKNIQHFVDSVGVENAYLTVRMLDSEENSAVLKSTALQEKVIADSLKLAQKYGFKGVVLDFEMGALPFSDVIRSMNGFVQQYYTAAQERRLGFMMTIYGDVFYRRRPYDVKFLSENSDEILVMAYDFHKAGSVPGPNFPLAGKEKYEYDFQQMVGDFTQLVPPEKLTIIYGMYGYDWMVDWQGRPMQSAKALPLKDVKSQFVESCSSENCASRRDPLSAESEVDYVKSGNTPYQENHIIWYEDEVSVAKKTEFLKSKGIGSIGYWTYGYF